MPNPFEKKGYLYHMTLIKLSMEELKFLHYLLRNTESVLREQPQSMKLTTSKMIQKIGVKLEIAIIKEFFEEREKCQ